MTDPIYATMNSAGTKLDMDLVNRVRLAELGGKRIVIYEDKRTRSDRANGYLWGVVYALMAKDQEMTPEEIHAAMCEKFLPNQTVRVEFFNKMTGKRLAVETERFRSSKLSGGPFYDFVERVREFARDFLNVHTPDPDPAYWRKRKAA